MASLFLKSLIIYKVLWKTVSSLISFRFGTYVPTKFITRSIASITWCSFYSATYQRCWQGQWSKRSISIYIFRMKLFRSFRLLKIGNLCLWCWTAFYCGYSHYYALVAHSELFSKVHLCTIHVRLLINSWAKFRWEKIILCFHQTSFAWL